MRLYFFTRLLLISIVYFHFTFCDIPHNSYQLPFDKVVIWGHKLHSNTFSYVHCAFYKAFKHLGYDVYHFDNQDNLENFDFKNSLFMTESQVDQNIPLRDDCLYILHNCDLQKYRKFYEQGNCIILQVYSHDCLKRNDTKIDTCIHCSIKDKILYMPWATDLLPHEIDIMKEKIKLIKKKREINWIGTIGAGLFGNIEQIRPFQEACEENYIYLKHYVNRSFEENIELIQQSFLAPAIVGKWQEEKWVYSLPYF